MHTSNYSLHAVVLFSVVIFSEKKSSLTMNRIFDLGFNMVDFNIKKDINTDINKF